MRRGRLPLQTISRQLTSSEVMVDLARIGSLSRAYIHFTLKSGGDNDLYVVILLYNLGMSIAGNPSFIDLYVLTPNACPMDLYHTLC